MNYHLSKITPVRLKPFQTPLSANQPQFVGASTLNFGNGANCGVNRSTEMVGREARRVLVIYRMDLRNLIPASNHHNVENVSISNNA
jgi:hypothetical protein